MHEISICESLIKAILEELDRIDAALEPRLASATVVVGKLRQIVPDNLTFAYEALGKDPRIAGSRLDIREVPVRAKCSECGWEGELAEKFFFCGACESGKIELVSGTELCLEKLEVVTNEQD